MFRPTTAAFRVTVVGVSLLALAACDENRNIDLDFRDNIGGFGTTAENAASVPRPQPDARGVISYPNYQVAVARRGDRVQDVAARIGLAPDELARFNGLTADTTLRDGEVLALPRRVSDGMAVAAAPLGTGGSGAVDVTTLAGQAIDRAAGQGTGTPTPSGTITPPRGSNEPVRHQVVRGETAYSIARLYGVSVRAIADWNGLGPDLTVREGSYLIIPQAGAPAPERATRPGEGSPTPVPPSSTQPLPERNETAAAPVETPPSPNLSQERTQASAAGRLSMPVQGSIIRAYQKGRNEGIDISATAGANVAAAADGTVAAVTRSTDNVAIVIVRHDGAAFGLSEPLLTVYANLEGITVERGARVSRGQTLGKVRAGNPAFMRFEVRKGFETLDPGQFLQ